MNVDEILRQLTNSGLRVLSVDSATIYIEDPSCVLRSFETFVEYAWVIITVITGMLLFAWAISMIRGVKNNIVTNVRNLLIMFATLAAVVPIVNGIWGGNLFARGCRKLSVPVANVQKILDARKIKPNKNNLYENFSIYDSGVPNGMMATDLIEMDVSDNDTPIESAPSQPPRKPNAPTPIRPAVPDDVASESGSARPIAPAPSDGAGFVRIISAEADGNDVIYTRSDSSRARYTGGTRAWRNTNPGNIRYSEFARNAGAIGRAGGFAVFPAEDTGMRAIGALLQSDSYRNLTVAQAISRYAPPFENDTAAYNRRIEQLTGLNINRYIRDLTPGEITRITNAIRQIEGWRIGRIIDL